MGLCSRHYQRNAKGEVLDPARIRVRRGTGSLRRDEYRSIVRDGVRYLEHRWVMSQMLGRPLLPEENVHHRNGIRSDNRRSNLELWVKSQPSGQRPADLVAFVLRYYPDLVRSQLKGAIS